MAVFLLDASLKELAAKYHYTSSNPLQIPSSSQIIWVIHSNRKFGIEAEFLVALSTNPIHAIQSWER
jgi:hypothetical protein